eukprot:6212700-Pleurochrysis_carterae.AAC.5
MAALRSYGSEEAWLQRTLQSTQRAVLASCLFEVRVNASWLMPWPAWGGRAAPAWSRSAQYRACAAAVALASLALAHESETSAAVPATVILRLPTRDTLLIDISLKNYEL